MCVFCLFCRYCYILLYCWLSVGLICFDIVVRWRVSLCITRLFIHHVKILVPVRFIIKMPSVLWHCWLGGMKGIWPVKNWAVGCWHGICLEQGADLHMAQLLPLPLTVSCFSKIQICFTFLVPAHLDSPGQRAIKRVCVCVCACVRACVRVWFIISRPSLATTYSRK